MEERYAESLGLPIFYRYPLERKAPHIGHGQHLCNLCESGNCSLEQIKKLVKDSKFICRVCGRAAVNEENLCEPVPL